MKKTPPGRCDYCQRPATFGFTYRGYLSARRNPNVTVHRRACDEHVGCTNWESARAMYPDAVIHDLGTGAQEAK